VIQELQKAILSMLGYKLQPVTPYLQK